MPHVEHDLPGGQRARSARVITGTLLLEILRE
jgi:hypothetical protein